MHWVRRSAEDEADWLCRTADAFQKVVLCTSRLPLDVQELGRNLTGIPAPTNQFQRFALRYFMFDSFGALVSGDIASRAPRPLDLAAVLGVLHSSPDLIAGFTKLVTKLCRPVEASDKSLAEEIGCRIEREYAFRMTAKQMAREYKVSLRELERSFVRRFGLGFHEYVKMVRVRHGVDLVCGGLKIEAAAQAVGYKSKKDFYRAIRMRTGLTPGQLRRQRRLTPRIVAHSPVKL